MDLFWNSGPELLSCYNPLTIPLTADIEHRFPILCYSKCNSILLHGEFTHSWFCRLLFISTILNLYSSHAWWKYFIFVNFFSGLLLGRVHFYHKSYSDACAVMHCNWPLFFTPIHCICSTCKYLSAQEPFKYAAWICVYLKKIWEDLRRLYTI